MLLVVILLGVSACTQGERTAGDDRAREVIEGARAAHGSDLLDAAEVTFRFRGDYYTAARSRGRFAYARAYVDSAGRPVRDLLSGAGVRREVEGRQANLSEQEERGVESTVNSVVYFALAPYNLADPAVHPRYLGPDTVRGEPYDVVEVTFAQEGGGRDWEDRFLYWFHADRSTMDYLAYRFHTGEGGTRFREAVNPRTVGGVRFADYRNYTADPDSVRLEDYPDLLEADQLRLLSLVELEEVSVDPRGGRAGLGAL